MHPNISKLLEMIAREVQFVAIISNCTKMRFSNIGLQVYIKPIHVAFILFGHFCSYFSHWMYCKPL